MQPDPRALAQMHARMFNAHDVDTLAFQYTRAARCIRDGELLGEGPDAVRDGIEAEYRTRHGAVARALVLDGETVIGEFEGEEGSEAPTGIIRFRMVDGELDEVEIDHDPERVARLGL